MEDPGVDGRIILRWIFRKWDVGAWTGSNWLKMGIGGGHLYKYSCTLSLTSALDVGGWSTPGPGRFTPEQDPVPIVQETE